MTSKTKSKQNIISISLKLEDIGQGIKTGIANALVRPYRVLINEERKVGRVSYVFYQENNVFYRIFGSFCYAPSGRLLFFHGLKRKQLLWDSADMVRSMPTKDIDHFTIEPDWKSWHITTLEKHKEKDKRISSRKLLKTQPNVFFWFGLSVRSLNELENVPKETNWTFPVSNQSRVINIFNESRNKAIWNILKLYPDQQLNNDKFLHFDVYLDTRRFRFFRGIPNLKVVSPTDKPALKEKISNKNDDIPVRIHKIKLKGLNADIYVVVSCHYGLLSNPTIITAHS